jgi:hypothetical protein
LLGGISAASALTSLRVSADIDGKTIEFPFFPDFELESSSSSSTPSSSSSLSSVTISEKQPEKKEQKETKETLAQVQDVKLSQSRAFYGSRQAKQQQPFCLVSRLKPGRVGKLTVFISVDRMVLTKPQLVVEVLPPSMALMQQMLRLAGTEPSFSRTDLVALSKEVEDLLSSSTSSTTSSSPNEQKSSSSIGSTQTAVIQLLSSTKYQPILNSATGLI